MADEITWKEAGGVAVAAIGTVVYGAYRNLVARLNRHSDRAGMQERHIALLEQRIALLEQQASASQREVLGKIADLRSAVEDWREETRADQRRMAEELVHVTRKVAEYDHNLAAFYREGGHQGPRPSGEHPT